MPAKTREAGNKPTPTKKRGRPTGSKTQTVPLITVFPPSCVKCGQPLTAESAPVKISERISGPLRLRDGNLYRTCQKQVRMCQCGQRNDTIEARELVRE